MRLLSAEALYPPDASGDTVAVCLCTFSDEAAVTAAFNSPETPAVMADVARFTDATPRQARAVPLQH